MDVNMSDFDHILWNLDHSLPNDFSEDFQEFWKVDDNNHLSVNPVDKSSCKPTHNTTISPSVLEVQDSNNHMDFAVQNNEIREMHNEMHEMPILDIHFSLPEIQSIGVVT